MKKGVFIGLIAILVILAYFIGKVRPTYTMFYCPDGVKSCSTKLQTSFPFGSKKECDLAGEQAIANNQSQTDLYTCEQDCVMRDGQFDCDWKVENVDRIYRFDMPKVNLSE